MGISYLLAMGRNMEKELKNGRIHLARNNDPKDIPKSMKNEKTPKLVEKRWIMNAPIRPKQKR
jgi:hypothetical protein